MCVQKENGGDLGLTHERQILDDKVHDVLVVVLEQAEVGVLTGQLVREVRELSDLKEIILFHLASLQTRINDLASSQEDSTLLGFT